MANSDDAGEASRRTSRSATMAWAGRATIHGRRVRIEDVAREARTSTSTTSRALTGRGYVSDTIRERVLSAARRLEYVPDANARSLKRRRGLSIGVLISDLENAFYAEIASGIEQVVGARGYNMVLANSDGDPDREMAAIEQFREMRTPGIIIAPVSRTYRDRLHRDDVAVVEIDRRMASTPTDAVLLDNNAGAMLGTAHLIALGHRRIGVLSGERHWTTGRERVAGYKQALREAGIAVDPALIAHSTFHPVRADAATRELLARVDDLTAVFAMNNVLALGAVRALRSSAAAFGEVSVVAFDDLPWMDLVDPPLTTVAQPTRSMGRRAAELLFCRLEGDRSPPTTLRLPPELVIRGSTRGPRLDESRNGLAG